MGSEPRPLYYTFGNHMHWVDMQWLWGYDVLPGCVADMLHLCRETGAKGCVNFDGIGYEKMAAECPEALADLRAAVQAGTIEPVGCSYGQPYGLFQPGESNVRQFTYGVRSVRRLLGVRPRTFWEEEFYFFPQLPQILNSCGFTGANLFFQWTWHTPEIPRERASLILWEGADGTRIPTLPRNDLNVHQWPEDFDGLLEQGLINELASPVIVQWLELMPSKDWMCRSEVLLTRLKELFADPRFDLRAGTCADIIASLRGQSGADIPIRRYAMDDVWHGMLLGKNADRHPRHSREVEREILAAESLATLAGLFGRPYASWDVYPTWELDEAWRELLAAQHHDNHECEGLCGFVASAQMVKAGMHAREVTGRTEAHLLQRIGLPVIKNEVGWVRSVVGVASDASCEYRAGLVQLPPFGFSCEPSQPTEVASTEITETPTVWTLTRNGLSVNVDVERGVITQIRSSEWPDGVLGIASPLLDLRQLVGGRAEGLPRVRSVDRWFDGLRINFERELARPDDPIGRPLRLSCFGLSIEIQLPADSASVDIRINELNALSRPDPGFGGATRMSITPSWIVDEIRTDTAFAIASSRGTGQVRRKYPRGDWMTSPQWFEQVESALHSHAFIDLLRSDGHGLFIAHNGSQQWFRSERGVEVVLNAYCPWDEERYDPDPHHEPALRVLPHAGMRDVDRARLASEFAADSDDMASPRLYSRTVSAIPVGGGDRSEAEPIPEVFGALEVTNAPGVLAHAFYRDSMKSGEHLPDWAGHRMARESAGACTHPFVIRLVEWNGEPAEVVLKLPGSVALAAKTSLLGECGGWNAGHAPADAPSQLRDTGWLTVEPATPPDWAKGAAFRGRPIEWSQVRMRMRPREIATIMADLVMGRKEFRDLDAKRKVWATIHKQGEPTDPGSSRP